MPTPPHLKGVLLALTGIILLSPDTLLVRMLDMEQWPLQFYRGSGTALALFVGMAVAYRSRAWSMLKAVGGVGLATAFAYAMSTILFISALYLTSVANTLAIISTAPLFGSLFSRLALKEKLPVRTWVAACLAVGAVGIIVAGDIGGATSHLIGDLVALAQAMFMAGGFVLIRSRPKVNMVPCMALSGLLVALFSFPLTDSLHVAPEQAALLGLLVLVVLPVSFALLFLAPRYIPAPEVSMIMLLEMVLGPLLVWTILGEAISLHTLVGGGLLFAIVCAHSALALGRGPFSRSATGFQSRIPPFRNR